MKLFVGLGNPGKRYENTRHNAGFLWIDAFAKYLSYSKYYVVTEEKMPAKEQFAYREIRNPIHYGGNKLALLVKPLTFMNLSGKVVQKLSAEYKIASDDIFIIHDDLDIPLGKFKIAKGIYPKTHRGILSIQSMVKNTQLWYVRIGVDNRQTTEQYKQIDPEDYVLLQLTDSELFTLQTTIIDSIKQLLLVIKEI